MKYLHSLINPADPEISPCKADCKACKELGFDEEPLGGHPHPADGIQPKKIENIGQLIEYLKQFSPTRSIAVNDNFGVPREKIFIEETTISSVLISTGDEILW